MTQSPAADKLNWRIGLWLTVAVMLLILHFNAMGQDIGFWRNWLWQFQMGGYRLLEANYPPVFLHWMRLLSWLFDSFGITPANDMLVKIAVQLPIMLSQLFLVEVVGRELVRHREDPLHSGLFWLTVCNPALLIGGPAWGMVDLLPFVPLYYAICSAVDRRLAVWTLPWMTLALLCKFQAIVFSPLLAGLALRHWRRQIPGALIAALIFAVAYIPFMLTTDVFKAVARAYWGNLSILPYVTLHAANLWRLLFGGDLHLDSLSLLTGQPARDLLSALLTPSKLGLLLFAIISLSVTAAAYRKPTLTDAFGLAVFSALGFFAVSTGMHERYLLQAIPFAALWGCGSPNRRFWYPLLSALVYFNINFILDLTNEAAWNIVSALVVLAFAAMALQLSGVRLTAMGVWLGNAAARRPALPYLCLLASWAVLLGLRIADERAKPPTRDMAARTSLYLGEMLPEQQFQQWGEPRINTNLMGQPLCIGSHCYQQGLATHANSFIAYRIPSGARVFHAEAGLDNSGAGGEATFALRLDGREVWNSGPLRGGAAPATVEIPVAGAKYLILEVEALASNLSDHADWADAHFGK